VLSVENLASAYGRIEVLHGVSMEVRSGEIVALVGANGAGKTTLLRAISGVQSITAGRVIFSGQPIETLPAHVRVALGIVQVPEGRQLFAPLSVEDNLKLGSWSRAAPSTSAPSWPASMGCFRCSARCAVPPPARFPAGSSKCSPSAGR